MRDAGGKLAVIRPFNPLSNSVNARSAALNQPILSSNFTFVFIRVYTRVAKVRFTPSVSLGRSTKSVRKEARATWDSASKTGWCSDRLEPIMQRVVVVVGVTPVQLTIGM